MLNRKGNPLKLSMFSFIIGQHGRSSTGSARCRSWTAKRIAFYGLSYGGETAVRVPPLLDGYCLSICSGDFNDWARKVAATDSDYSFMFSIEWEMPYFNMGSTFNYAEMAYLMVPAAVHGGTRPPRRRRAGRVGGVGVRQGALGVRRNLGLADRTDDRVLQRRPHDQRPGHFRLPCQAPGLASFCRYGVGTQAPTETNLRWLITAECLRG